MSLVWIQLAQNMAQVWVLKQWFRKGAKFL